jgi:D-alanyl-D-alanine carboxypeptidase
MTRNLKAWLATAAALSLALAAQAEASPPLTKSQLKVCLAHEGERLGFSGVIEVVSPKGAMTYVRGLVGEAGSPPIAANTRFNLGSAGKMFTAVAVGQLIDAGKVRLDDPIGRHVAGLSAPTAAVTVRQLLNHSSGLGNFFTPDNLSAVEKARTASDLLPLVAAETPAFTPGARFQYSNSGFLLLGVMIERVSGQSYDAYLRAHVFGPAGMDSSGMEPVASPARALGLTALGAGGEGSSPLRPARESAIFGGPAGGGYSTAPDLQRFFAALSEGRLTLPRTFAALTSTQVEIGPPPKAATATMTYGFGFGVGTYEGHPWYGHNGGTLGVSMETNLFAKDQTLVVVLANRDPPIATQLMRQIRAILFKPGATRDCGRSASAPPRPHEP